MDDIEKILRKAEKLLDAGRSKEFHSILADLIDKEVPEDLHLSACFGRKGESDQQFYQSNLWLINKAA